MFGFVLLSSGSYASEEKYLEIVVVRHDTVITLCSRYLEDPGRWREVTRINRLADPYTIFPGQRLIIPLALLKGTPLEGTISFLKGDVEVRRKDSDLWNPIRLNEKISPGDTIKTGDEGAAEITFEDSTALYIKSATELEVKRTAKKGAFLLIREFFQRAGRTISRLKAAMGGDSRFRIYTPSAVAAARGTEFRVSVDEQETTRAEILQGTINVEAKSEQVAVPEGEGTFVIKDNPPVKPRKLLPPPSPLHLEALYRTRPVVVYFTEVPGASFYRTILARDREMKDVIVDDVFKPDRGFRVVNLEDGSYFMQTQSIDAEGLEGLPSDQVSIRVRTNPLPPFIEGPAEGTAIRGKEVSIKWLKVGDAVSYHLQMSEDREFRTIAVEQKTIEGSSYKSGDLSYKTYYFRLRSVAGDGYEGIWSDTQSFSLVPPPSAPQMDGPRISDKEIHIRWPNLGEGISYHFQMASDPEFRTVLAESRSDRAEMTLQKPDKAGTYYVRVSSIDATGYEGKFSPSQSFEIKKKSLYGIWGVAGALGVILWLLL